MSAAHEQVTVLRNDPELLKKLEMLNRDEQDDGLPGPRRESTSLGSSPSWPSPLRSEAFHGLAGDLVRLIEPHSESDPAALLVQFLVAYGNCIGRGPYFMAEADQHHTNLFAVLVGLTAKGRKGTSFGHVRRIITAIDADWAENRMMSGLSSGEGLIWQVRDQIVGRDAAITDEGIADKRLLVVEPEFARVLQVAERESNTLSAIIRQAWDSGDMRILTKKDAARATGAHISIIGHITRAELRRLLGDTAVANGFANRFLWVCVKRSKLLPEGGALADVDFQPTFQRLSRALDFARNAGQLVRDDDARTIWAEIYGDLSEGRVGLVGSVTSRAEPQVMRLASVYALLDCSHFIRAEHLLAALEVWRYSEESAVFIFGDALGDATADEILRALRGSLGGMTRNEIRDHFGRHKSSTEIGRALTVLLEAGLARSERETDTGGRPSERWFCTTGNAR